MLDYISEDVYRLKKKIKNGINLSGIPYIYHGLGRLPPL